MPSERKQIERAIAHMEEQRAVLGDTAVNAALVGLYQKLASLDDSAPGEQRKQVTIFFADVSGFTAMSETMDPEEVNRLMDDLWIELDAIIEEHGGLVTRHLGDELMALWGTEMAREDDPERAIHAALEIQTLLQDGRHGDLAMRVGINTGPALIGEITSTGEFNVMGDTINLASRLETIAPVGGILISHDTYNQVRGIFDVQEQEPIEVRGKRVPLKTYVVQAAKARAFRVRTRGVEGIETRMIGRDAEMEALQQAYHLATSGRRAQLVTLTGEAGIGKSRLLYEFRDWIDVQPESLWFFQGRATPETHTTPYGLLRSLFSFRFEIRDNDSPQEVRNKLALGLADLGGIVEAEPAQRIGQLLGFDMRASNGDSDEQSGQVALSYLAQFFRTAASDDGAIIYMEDIHWSDSRTLDTLEYLMQACADVPLLVICAARPVLYERRPNWGQRHARVSIEPLSSENSAALVDEILRKASEVPPDLRDLITSNAEGNPFYVEELVKMLIEDNIIIPGADGWAIQPFTDKELRVPTTLTGVLQARLDVLPAAERALLQRASVIGRIFWDDALASLHARDELPMDDIGPVLDVLQQRELIFREDTSTFSGVGEYRFKHAVLRDVAYESVLLKQRHTYHRQAAEWLVMHAGERVGEFSARIAEHYQQAQNTSEAANYLEQAGSQAIELSALDEACEFFGRALKLVREDSPQKALILARNGMALLRLAKHDKARAVLEDALALGKTFKNRVSLSETYHALGQLEIDMGNYPGAVRYFTQYVEMVRALADDRTLGHARAKLGLSKFRAGQIASGRAHLQAALEIATETGDLRGQVVANNGLSTIALMNEQLELGLQHIEASLLAARELGDPWAIQSGLNNRGWLALAGGRFEEARGYLEEALALGEKYGFRIEIAMAHSNLGQTLANLGKADAAREAYLAAMATFHEIGSVTGLIETTLGLAHLAALDGQLETAAEWIGAAANHPGYFDELDMVKNWGLGLCEAGLSPAELEAALTRGRQHSLEDIVDMLLAEKA